MKKKGLYRFALITLAAALLIPAAGCGGPSPGQEPEPGDGGTVTHIDSNAPKTIESTEITSFECMASLVAMVLEPEDEELLTESVYTFTAERDGDIVRCTGEIRGGKTNSFTADLSFLDALQDIIVRYDLVRQNGITEITSGLPDDFGSMLSVLYASGESIYFHDNSEPMLSLDVVKELVVLYGLEPEPEPAYTVLTPEEAMTIVTSGDYADCLIVDVRQPDEYAEGHIPGAVCVPNEDIQAEQTGALPDPDQMLLLYSGSGSRSKEAAQKLTELGYTYVCEFGGIVDWPGEVVTD